MATDRRIERINKTLMKEIGTIIMTEIKDPRLNSMVSVMDVTITKNLQYVKVVVSIFGENEATNMKTLEALNHASGFVSSIVSKNLRMRSAPEIRFVRTDSIEKSMDIYYKIKEYTDDIHETDED